MQQQLRAGLVQPKLTISQPHDRFEQEADRVAESVMRMQNPVGQTALPGGDPPPVQRKCTECEEEEVQRKANSESEQVGFDFNHPTSGGRPLPDSERSFFEPRFGQDFSDVRVHSDAQAGRAASSINALAYTKGSHVVFGEGQYRPGTNSGRTLIAHELAHVVQQGGSGPSSGSSGVSGPTISRSTENDLPSIQRMGNLSQRPANLLCDVPTTSAAFVDTNILFSLNSSALTPTAIAAIATFIGRWTAAGANAPVRIDGFASKDGPEPLNWTLSCDRALLVEAELTAPSSGAAGVPANLVTVFAQGETDEFSRSFPPNRRATISANLNVPPPPVCANPGVLRDLDLQPVFLRTGPADPNPTGVRWRTMFNEANVIWGKIGVRFHELTPITVDTPLKSSGRTAAERTTIRGLRTGAGVEIFMVANHLGPGFPGGADTLPPIGAGCGATGNIVISDIGTSDTLLAHELGHILGLDHPTAGPPFNPGEANTILEPSGSDSTPNPTRNTMVNFSRILCPAGAGSTCLNPDP